MSNSDWKPGQVSRDYRSNYDKIFKPKKSKERCKCEPGCCEDSCDCGEDCKCTKE